MAYHTPASCPEGIAVKSSSWLKEERGSGYGPCRSNWAVTAVETGGKGGKVANH